MQISQQQHNNRHTYYENILINMSENIVPVFILVLIDNF